MNPKSHPFSLPGVITIVHLSLCVGLLLAHSALADVGGVVVVDSSNRLAVSVLNWFGFLLACPLYALMAPRGGFHIVWFDILGIVLNSCLVGLGLAGGIRLVIRRQFGLRFVFVLTTLMAICLCGVTYASEFLILSAALLAFAALALNSNTTRPRSKAAAEVGRSVRAV